MELNVIGAQPYRISGLKDLHLICKLVDSTIGKLPGRVNLIFCDDPTIHRLNKEYRKKDKVTDVLTFTYYKGEPSATELLGEVIVSIPKTKRQAEEYGISFKSELYKLCIHGLLHLRGYDHEEDDDYRVMKLLEDKIMRSFLSSKKS